MIISDLMRSLGDNNGYYNPGKILPYLDDTMVFFIVGERRIGKTDYFLRLACRLYIETGKQTMWIRNKLVELQDPSFHAAFLTDAKRYGWCPPEWETRSDGVYTSEGRDGQQVILFQSITTFSNRRGGSNPDVLMMVFDEFMPEDRRYPPAAAKGLMSLTKTVFSGNSEARVFCLSNIVSAVNPYFAAFRIYPEAGRDVTLYPDKRILIERCRGYHRAIEQDNPWTAIYRAGRYGDYADESEDDLLSLVVDRMPKGLAPYDWGIVASGQLYRAYAGDRWIYFARQGGDPPRGLTLYTADREAVSNRVRYIPSDITRAIKGIFDRGLGRFIGANCLFDIMSIIYTDL